MAGRVSTGISALDRKLEGGIPEGSILFLSADPASQSELLLYELTDVRPTLYLTTVRSEQAVRDALDRTPMKTGDPHVRDVGGDAPLDNAHRLIRDLPESANLVLDVVDPLEDVEPTRYRGFLNELQTHLVNTGGVGIVHGMQSDSPPANRDLTKHMADVVFDLQTTVKGTDLVNRLSIPKFRGGTMPEETVKLQIGEQITVDTSRDIA